MKKIFQILIIVCLIFPVTVHASDANVSGKTASQLITDIRYLLNETTADFWDDDALLSYLNAAVVDVTRKVPQSLMTGTTQFVLDTGTSEYPVVQSHLAIRDVIWQSGTTDFKTLNKGSLLGLGKKDNKVGDPSYYYMIDNRIGVYPLQDTIDRTVTGTTIYVITTPIPTTMTTSSTIQTPAVFDRALVFYAVSQALLQKMYFNAANSFTVQYTLEVNRVRIDMYESEKSIWDIITPKQ